MVEEITQILGMHEFVTVKAASNRPNITYIGEKMETVPDEELKKREQLMHHIFGEGICDLNNNGKKASKVIVFCFLRNDCAMIYEFFLQKLGNHSLVNMFTNITGEISKKSIITQFWNLESELRVGIATVAFGMCVKLFIFSPRALASQLIDRNLHFFFIQGNVFDKKVLIVL